MKKKKYLLTRYGGMGDVAPVMVVAEQLKKQGHSVDIALREDDHGLRQVDFLENTEVADSAMTFKEIGPWKTRCVSFKHGWVDIKNKYPEYDEVVDFMHIIEYNDTCHSSFAIKPSDEWMKHRNSNWQNWYDLHLAWANIDPTSVPDDEKRPVFILSEDERDEVDKIREGVEKVIVINPHASSLARTWYQAEDMIPKLIEEYPNSKIFYWEPSKSHWKVFDKLGVSEYSSPIKSSIRASMCVVGSADIYIGADTGFTHVAEGLEIPHIAVYSSVPAWTRAKYYQYQTPIDKGPHSFALTLGDPHRIEEGINALSKKEKKLLELHESGIDIQSAAKAMNTTPEGVNLEMDALQRKISSFERVQSKALTAVTVKEVMGKIKEVLA